MSTNMKLLVEIEINPNILSDDFVDLKIQLENVVKQQIYTEERIGHSLIGDSPKIKLVL